MNTHQIEQILTTLLPNNFIGVFAQDRIPNIDSALHFPLSFVSNTHPSTKPGEHWVAFYYTSPDTLEFFDSYGLHPSIYGFTDTPSHINHKTLQSLDSNVCGQYCIYYLYHRSRGKTMSKILSSFSTDQAWNDKSVARFVSKHFPTRSCISCTCCQSCIKRKLCSK